MTESARSGTASPSASLAGPAGRLETVEGHGHRRVQIIAGRHRGAGELTHEVLVEDGDLAVEDERGWPELRDGRSQLGETVGMPNGFPAHESNTAAVLVSENAPSFDLPFVDPAVAVDGLMDEGRGPRDRGEKGLPPPALSGDAQAETVQI